MNKMGPLWQEVTYPGLPHRKKVTEKNLKLTRTKKMLRAFLLRTGSSWWKSWQRTKGHREYESVMEEKLKGVSLKPLEACHCHPNSQVVVPFMSAFFLCSPSLGHPILEAPESVTGIWKGNINIPCTYGPLKGYTQVLVKWLVQRGSDPVTIFLRDSSGDHIQQAKYRGRLRVNHEILGDVSFQLNTLEMDDRNHYTCEVTWQTPNGNQVVRDKIIDLRVQKGESLWG